MSWVSITSISVYCTVLVSCLAFLFAVASQSLHVQFKCTAKYSVSNLNLWQEYMVIVMMRCLIYKTNKQINTWIRIKQSPLPHIKGELMNSKRRYVNVAEWETSATSQKGSTGAKPWTRTRTGAEDPCYSDMLVTCQAGRQKKTRACWHGLKQRREKKLNTYYPEKRTARHWGTGPLSNLWVHSGYIARNHVIRWL